jgi:hypothetical protein
VLGLLVQPSCKCIVLAGTLFIARSVACGCMRADEPRAEFCCTASTIFLLQSSPLKKAGMLAGCNAANARRRLLVVFAVHIALASVMDGNNLHKSM